MNEKKTISLFVDKYKPKTFEEFCRYNPRLFEILDVFFQMNRFNLLFIGDSGSGKTLLLNILIKKYFEQGRGGDPTEYSAFKNEVLFINNLKEQGMQFYRNDMKSFCQSHCSIPGKKKIVVIDDMDTINEQGQHVFRNYMDKYSSNVIFFTVCTDLQKIIESLQSRLHVIKIDRPGDEQMRYILETICEKEDLILKENAKMFILSYCQSSIRHLIGYLEKLYLYSMYFGKRHGGGGISLPLCKSLCSDIKTKDFDSYIEFLKVVELSTAIDLMYELYDSGFSVIDIYELFFIYIKYNTISTIRETNKYDIIKLLCYYMYIFYNSHENVVELVLFTNELYKIIR